MGEALVAFAAGHWRTVVVGLVTIALAFWIGVLRLERDSARAQVAVEKAKLGALSAQVSAQNASIETWKATAERVQTQAQAALAAAEKKSQAWQSAAQALAAYKRTPAVVTRYEKVEVTDDECRIAKGMAQSAWAAARGSVRH